MSRTKLAGLLTCCVATILVLGRLALPRQAVAETTGIAGRVYHLVTLEPIAGAAVAVGDEQAITDQQGFYELALPAGRYTVAAQAAGYIAMSQSLQPVSANLTAVDFAMIPLDPGEEMNNRIVQQMALLEQAASPEWELVSPFGQVTASGITQVPETIRLAVRQDPAVIDSPIVEIITLDFEEYIKGVVPYEMSPSWPQAALEAQAVAARSYAAANLGKHAADGADVCSSVHCQVWRPTHYATTDRAVDATRGIAATYNGSIIYAFFHSHCDGHTRSSQEVWGGSVPYLVSVPCSCGYTERLGHGVGMCQYGASAMANAGATYEQIIKHYYTGVSLLAGPAGALSDASVEPLTGSEGDTYTFRVRYTSSASTPPPMANVIIDGHAYAMSPDGGSLATGWGYEYSTRLTPGPHTVRYEFDDGQGRLSKLPSAGTLTGPVVAAALPPPAAESSLRTSITASTALDWAGGQFDGVQVLAADKDLLSLAAGRTQGMYTSPVLAANASFVAYGLVWYAQTPDGSSVSFETRSSLDGLAWGAWHTEIGEPYVTENERLQSAELVFGEARYVQYRVTLSGTSEAPPAIRNLRVVIIDSRAGPLASALDSTVQGTATAPAIISRAAWGADESWMTWAPEYPFDSTVRAMVLHHTVTSDGGVDPAAVVRAIYAYHALPEPYGRGWGDIGYNYLVDASGRIYQGRFGN
ncbi:MAG: SpoIID/LytB domain-containing protein, partial [Anaerolineae bacterium]